MNLVEASDKGRLDVVQFLIAKGVDTYDLDRALGRASERGHLPVVEFLVANGANVRANDDEALRMASYYGRLDVVKFLVSKGADIHALYDAALIDASSNNHLTVVEFLVAKGANVRADKDAALRYASRNGHLNVIKVLVEAGAKSDEKKKSLELVLTEKQKFDEDALRMACYEGNLDVVKLLVEQGVRIGDSLLLASERGHLPVVEFLVSKGVDIHALDDYALIEASRREHVKVVDFLLEQEDYPMDVIKRAQITSSRVSLLILKDELRRLELVSTFLANVKQGAYTDITKNAKVYYIRTHSNVYTDYMASIVENASMDTLQFLINSFYYQAGFIKSDVLSDILNKVSSEDKREYLERVLTEIAPYVDIQQFDDVVPDDFPDAPEECQVLDVVLGGSTGARLVQCGRNQYVRKQAAVITQSDFIYNEYLANQIYRLLGVAVPDVRFYTNKRTATLLSRYITPSSPLDTDETDVVETIRSSFVVDAFLANWDVLGSIIVKGDIPYRVDNGGALFFRAKGTMKSVSQLTNAVRELDTMRIGIFESLTNDQVCKQIIHYTPLIESLIIPRIKSEVLRRVLGGRLEYMQRWGLVNSTEPQRDLIKIQSDVATYVSFFSHQLAYIINLNMVMRQLVGEYIQVKEATSINDALCSGSTLTPYQMSIYKTLLNTFYGVPPIDVPFKVYRGLSLDSSSFDEKRLTCQFVSTSTDINVAIESFAGDDGLILDITVLPGSKVLPLYGYFRTAPRYVGVYIVYNGALLVHRRSKALGGFLISPGGTVDKGERPIKAALREMLEESGVVLTDADLVKFYDSEDGMFTGYVFYATTMPDVRGPNRSSVGEVDMRYRFEDFRPEDVSVLEGTGHAFVNVSALIDYITSSPYPQEQNYFVAALMALEKGGNYIRNVPTITSYEEDINTYDTEMEVLLPPNGDWVRGREYTKGGNSYIEYTFST